MVISDWARDITAKMTESGASEHQIGKWRETISMLHATIENDTFERFTTVERQNLCEEICLLLGHTPQIPLGRRTNSDFAFRKFKIPQFYHRIRTPGYNDLLSNYVIQKMAGFSGDDDPGGFRELELLWDVKVRYEFDQKRQLANADIDQLDREKQKLIKQRKIEKNKMWYRGKRSRIRELTFEIAEKEQNIAQIERDHSENGDVLQKIKRSNQSLVSDIPIRDNVRYRNNPHEFVTIAKTRSHDPAYQYWELVRMDDKESAIGRNRERFKYEKAFVKPQPTTRSTSRYWVTRLDHDRESRQGYTAINGHSAIWDQASIELMAALLGISLREDWEDVVNPEAIERESSEAAIERLIDRFNELFVEDGADKLSRDKLKELIKQHSDFERHFEEING